jgi:hypothetical protein
MKVSKREAHKKRLELAEKPAVLRSRHEQLRKNLWRKAEREIDVLKRVEARFAPRSGGESRLGGEGAKEETMGGEKHNSGKKSWH